MIFHHEGIVTKDIEQETETYKSMGFEVESDFEDPIQNVRGRFMKKDGFRVELLEPLNEKSPLSSYLSRGVKIYHHAFKTDSIENTIDHLIERNFFLSEVLYSQWLSEEKLHFFFLLQAF